MHYKLSGSSTCAVVDITHSISMMVESNDHVRCLFIDFSKASDTADHCILVVKLAKVSIPVFAL